MAAVEFVIDTRQMRYTGEALASLKNSGVDKNLKSHQNCKDSSSSKHERKKLEQPSPYRGWLNDGNKSCPPQPAKARHIGKYALTTEIASWIKNALADYEPSVQAQDLVKPFADEFHALMVQERKLSAGLHDLDAIELTYQYALEINAAILLAADSTEDPVDISVQLHSSQAGGDDHFTSWGKLLTGLECDPPIIVQFPFYLLMCQSFTLEPKPLREDYVYSALTGVDWAKGQNKFTDRLAAFEDLARSSVPTLDDHQSGMDRSFWRIALGYLRSMTNCENARSFQAPRKATIEHGLGSDLVIIARGIDTIGSAFMSRDGASWLDSEGMDSLIGSGLANDVMDLHTDIFIGETRNLLRLLYPSNMSISQAMQTMSTILTSMLCEVFRGHHRARLHNREDGRISSTSPPYSFSRARHRRIFETMEQYISHYPKFWEWTWEIYNMAKSQLTEAALAEPLICGMKRAGTHQPLPQAPSIKFFHLWYDMVEGGSTQLSKPNPLGVSKDLAPVVRGIHNLWHQQLLDDSKKPGWGREFDHKSDMLLGEAGEILSHRGEVCDETYRFTIAYGRLSMALPYIAYHTIDAIILAFGAIP